MNNVLKIAIGIVLAVALVAGIMYAFGACPEAKPCSAKEQLLDLKAEIRGGEKVREQVEKTITDKAGNVANYVLATERLKAAEAEKAELKARIESLEHRLVAVTPTAPSAPSQARSVVDPPKPNFCDTLSQADKEICNRTRPR